MKKTQNRFGRGLKYVACIAFSIAAKLPAEEPEKLPAKLPAEEPTKTIIKKFHITGDVGRNEDGSFTIYLRNVSPDESDYLIALGDVTCLSFYEDKNKEIMVASIQSVHGEPYLAKVKPSPPSVEVIFHTQFLPLKFKLPEEDKNAKFDSIDLTIKLCKTPISTKNVVLEALTVRLPVTENHKREDEQKKEQK